MSFSVSTCFNLFSFLLLLRTGNEKNSWGGLLALNQSNPPHKVSYQQTHRLSYYMERLKLTTECSHHWGRRGHHFLAILPTLKISEASRESVPSGWAVTVQITDKVIYCLLAILFFRFPSVAQSIYWLFPIRPQMTYIVTTIEKIYIFLWTASLRSQTSASVGVKKRMKIKVIQGTEETILWQMQAVRSL